MATFHNFDFKIKSVKQQGLFSPMMGVCINVIDGCMYIFMLYFSRHKVLTLSLKNKQFLNFNCALLIIKFEKGLKIMLSSP